VVDRAARRARSFLDPDLAERLTEAADGLTVALADAPVGRLRELPTPVAEALTLVDAASRLAVKQVGETREDPDAVRQQQAKANLEQLVEVTRRLLELADHDVVWTEGDRRSPSGSAPAVGASSIVVAPLSVSDLLGLHLYRDRTVIATSATLTLGGAFDTVAGSLGLDSSADEPVWRELDVGSPFDYRKQGILYVAAHLPRPTESGLSGAAGEELVRLCSALCGRTLGLFSSRRAATRAAEVIREKTDLEVLLQGEDSLPALVRRFRTGQRSCLFGVLSLWQGVDIPGDACQLVVIDRLPFPHPEEPVAAARAAAVDAKGGSGFAAVSVPIAAVRLAQGVGRLVRRSTDRGVVAVLDSRLHHSRAYGEYLRRSLPPFWYTTGPDVVGGALRRLAADTP
ncbi:MAG TPA: ATP-dependent DNA helicase, partial [Micromonosporaceae bacterium]|nr:ATP-dependent DNA helicase [Micromonosporaceae bacterium]